MSFIRHILEFFEKTDFANFAAFATLLILNEYRKNCSKDVTFEHAT